MRFKKGQRVRCVTEGYWSSGPSYGPGVGVICTVEEAFDLQVKGSPRPFVVLREYGELDHAPFFDASYFRRLENGEMDKLWAICAAAGPLADALLQAITLMPRQKENPP